ncbi:RNA polymerase sigma factor [Patescibacteria group bacterium]|nr:RNA polymerase sigma factor [Patescibacteria group bacterium]
MENLNQLLHKACKGDKDAFGQIYKIYFSKIYRYCRINLGSETEAQDIAQETFFKAWRSISNFSIYEGGSIQAFLFRIARNTIIDLSRKKREFPLDAALEIESNDDFEAEVDKKRDIEIVQQALLKLQEEDRQIVILRFFEEMPNAEIAQVMKVNEGAIRVRLHRILKKLKEIIQ